MITFRQIKEKDTIEVGSELVESALEFLQSKDSKEFKLGKQKINFFLHEGVIQKDIADLVGDSALGGVLSGAMDGTVYTYFQIDDNEKNIEIQTYAYYRDGYMFVHISTTQILLDDSLGIKFRRIEGDKLVPDEFNDLLATEFVGLWAYITHKLSNRDTVVKERARSKFKNNSNKQATKKNQKK